MTERDYKARMIRRARHYRRMARDALKASRQSYAPNSLIVMAQEWYSLALQIENMLPSMPVSAHAR
jgi:hypothetical protein